MKYKILLIFSLIMLNLPTTTFAVDVAPRISDREIIEKLATLSAGQAAIRSEMQAGYVALGKRMDDMNQRMGDMNQRMGDMNQRISSQQSTMLALFSSMVALILALFAYIAWDRRTMLKPIGERVENLGKDVTRVIDISNKDGSLLTRLVKAMRELAKEDERVATVLRSFSLM